MKGQIMKQYAIGDVVWVAECGTQHVTKTCPVCFGDRAVTIILGNDDRVRTPCNYCGNGYDGPHGVITEREYVAAAKQYTITDICSEVTRTGETRTYHSAHSVLREDAVFDNEADATEQCKEIAAKAEEEQRTRAGCAKKNSYKSYSWNVGYHMQQAKDKHRQAERHELNAVLCKERIRKDKRTDSYERPER